MKTRSGDVLIIRKPGVSMCLVGLVLDDGDTQPHQPKPATFADALTVARSTIAETSGRVFQVEGDDWTEISLDA